MKEHYYDKNYDLKYFKYFATILSIKKWIIRIRNKKYVNIWLNKSEKTFYVSTKFFNTKMLYKKQKIDYIYYCNKTYCNVCVCVCVCGLQTTSSINKRNLNNLKYKIWWNICETILNKTSECLWRRYNMTI